MYIYVCVLMIQNDVLNKMQFISTSTQSAIYLCCQRYAPCPKMEPIAQFAWDSMTAETLAARWIGCSNHDAARVL